MKRKCKLTLLKKSALLSKVCLAALAVSLAFFACDKDEIGDIGSAAFGEETEVLIYLDVPKGPTVLRSIDTLAENTIKSVDLLAFQGGKLQYWTQRILTGDSVKGESQQDIKMTVHIDKNEQDFVIITNASDIISAKNPQNSIGASKDTYLASLEISLSATADRWKAISASDYDYFPMWGEVKSIVNENTLKLPAMLVRALAKVDLQVDESVENFKLKSVRLLNTLKNGRLVPDPNVIELRNGGTYSTVNAATLPATPIKVTNPIYYDHSTDAGITERAIKGSIFLFETKPPADAYKLDATCMIVGGSYRDSSGTWIDECYYRVDFKNKDTNVYEEVLRNHYYLFNINTVKGRGYPTWEDAYYDINVDMNVEILDWDVRDTYDITFDEQWYLAVSRDEFILSKEAQTNSDLNVITDYSPYAIPTSQHGWTLLSITDNATNAHCTWLSTTPWILNQPTGRPNEKLDVPLIVTANTTAGERNATLVFGAGRLRRQVWVRQTLLEKASITINEMENGVAISENPAEIVFPVTIGVSTDPKHIRIDWTPKASDFVCYSSSVYGYPSAGSDAGSGVIGVTTGGNGGAPLNTSIGFPGTNVISQSTIDAEPLYEHADKLVMVVSNGLNTVERTLVIRRIYYNLITQDLQTSYPKAQGGSFKVKSNTPWIVTVSPANILTNVTTGGNGDPKNGETVSFKVNSTASVGQTVTLTFRSTSSKFADKTASFTIN